MQPFGLTEFAEIDLAELWSFLALETTESFASGFLKRLEARYDQIRMFPFSGAPRPHLATGLRVLFHEKYGIYYFSNEQEIIIARILHGSRDLAAIADDGGFIA